MVLKMSGRTAPGLIGQLVRIRHKMQDEFHRRQRFGSQSVGKVSWISSALMVFTLPALF
jgi:hypothetical protein